MNNPLFAFILLLSLTIVILRKCFPAVWATVQFPLVIVLSLLTVVLISVMLYAAYTMLCNTAFSTIEKTLYCILMAGLAVFFVWLNLSNWKKWHNERKR